MIVKIINKIVKKIKLLLKKFMWSCKSTIEILKSDKSSAALKISKVISQLIKLAGVIVSCIGMKDMIKLGAVTKTFKFTLDSLFGTTYSDEIKEVSLHNKDFDRFFGVIRSIGGMMIVMIGRLIEVYTDYAAHKQGVTKMQNPLTGNAINEGFGISMKRDSKFIRRYNDDMLQALLFVTSLMSKAIGKAVKGIVNLISFVRLHGYSKEIEMKLRNGELSEHKIVEACKVISLNELNRILQSGLPLDEEEKINKTINLIRRAKSLDDFYLMETTTIGKDLKFIIDAYKQASNRLERELNSKKLTRDSSKRYSRYYSNKYRMVR